MSGSMDAIPHAGPDVETQARYTCVDAEGTKIFTGSNSINDLNIIYSCVFLRSCPRVSCGFQTDFVSSRTRLVSDFISGLGVGLSRKIITVE